MLPVTWGRRVQAYNDREEREAKERITHAYYVSRWSRVANLPSLESLLNPPPEAVELPDDEVERQKGMVEAVVPLLDILNAKAAARKAAKG